MQKRLLTLGLAALAFLVVPLQAMWNDPSVKLAPQINTNNHLLTTRITDQPALWWNIWWIDVGDVSDFCISNTLQGGVFARHPLDVHPYEGLYVIPSITEDLDRGSNAEYPKGSGQYYNYAWGLWVGSMYPTGKGKSPNVSKCAYNTDLGAMSAPEMQDGGGIGDASRIGLYFSDQVIPKGYGFSGEGGNLFADPGTTPLSYQVKWPFADSTGINPKRRALGMSELNPDNGDVVSMQDTYACAGDWIPVGDARGIWIMSTGPYDVWGQGLRIEQRTYAWNYEYNNSVIFINYKIRNMNDFALDSVYFSFFMDNDIGSGGTNPGDDGFWDDLIGFDQNLNMGYTYDANGSEAGWVTPAGYIGAIFLETPEDIGLTGLETWQNATDQVIDNLGTDSIKYVYMTSQNYVTWDNPTDVRQLMNCGPYMQLLPNEEVNLTVAVILAYSLDELRAKAKIAKIQYDNGYFGYTPPPNPKLSIVPGDSTVYVTWSADPESFVDPMSKQKTFEGYRVYRSLSGLSGTWDLKGDYDLSESKNPDTVVAKHSVGPSKATIKFEKVLNTTELSKLGFSNNTYTITFQPDTVDTYYIVYDVGEQKVLNYNEAAKSEGGFCVLDSVDGLAKQLPAGKVYYPYTSGDVILIDGAQFVIADGVSGEPGSILKPWYGDQFTIKTYTAEAIGGQAGIRHYYLDEDVKNGQIYYYSVTSYSRPQPTENVGSLEGGKTGQTYWAVPRSNPLGWQEASAEKARRVAGSGNALVIDSVISPDQVTGHEYEVGFRGVYDTLIQDTIVKYAYFKDVTDNKILLDNYTVRSGTLSGPIIDGVLVQVAAVTMDTLDLETQMDTLKTGWLSRPSGTNLDFKVEWPQSTAGKPVPRSYDFICEVVDSARDALNRLCKFKVKRYDNNQSVPFLWGNESSPEIRSGSQLTIYYPTFVKENNAFTLSFIDTIMQIDTTINGADTNYYDTVKIAKYPKTGDKFLIKVLKPTTTADLFRFQTTKASIDENDTTRTLADIRVVPNPYYIRAAWDRTQYDRHILFQNLPMKCTIRLFSSAGLLIRTIKHDGTGLTGKAGSEEWNLLTEEGLDCTSGLYIWQVETEDGRKALGKFAIVR